MNAQTNEMHWSSANVSPVLDLSLPRYNQSFVVLEGDSDDTLAFGLGRSPEGYLPADSGTVVISANEHFNFLQNLTLNDQVVLSDPMGGEFHYGITHMDIIDLKDNTIDIHDNVDELKLVSSWPFGSGNAHTTMRYVVKASKIDALILS
ncbi:MAG: class D sortase [Gammaproteobacteria bacterium]|nr:class D sortase [Gammaproteobacteria bacterium]